MQKLLKTQYASITVMLIITVNNLQPITDICFCTCQRLTPFWSDIFRITISNSHPPPFFLSVFASLSRVCVFI